MVDPGNRSSKIQFVFHGWRHVSLPYRLGSIPGYNQGCVGSWLKNTSVFVGSLFRDSRFQGAMMVNKPLIRPYFLGGVARIPLKIPEKKEVICHPAGDEPASITFSNNPSELSLKPPINASG